MGKNNRWLAIVNLLSGSGKCGRDWEHIARILYSKGIDFDTVFTGRRQHAIELARRGIIEDGYRNIIAIGGDGTIHEVANGILTQTEVDPAEVRIHRHDKQPAIPDGQDRQPAVLPCDL